MATILQLRQSQHEARVPVSVFELEGELDSSNYEGFQNEMQQAIEAGARYVALDFSHLRYISSAGLRALFALAKILSAKNGTATGTTSAGSFKSPYLKLLNPSPTVRQALDVMGFNMSIEIHSNLDEVLASF
jgi:anti-anti-sigma factor